MASKQSRLLAALGGAQGAFLSAVAALVGVLIGVGVFTFGYANGLAYFGHDPKTCQQCHAMDKQYDAWGKGSHKAVATCQDCHIPHDNVVNYLIAEADNGFWHSLKFTTGWYPDNIKIRESNRQITEHACRNCHEALVSDIESSHSSDYKQGISCIKCHSEVGHKR